MDLHDVAAMMAAPAPPMRFRKGAVTAISSTGTLTVTIAGSTVPVSGVKALSSVCAKVGSGVWLAADGLDVFAIGVLSPQGPAHARTVKSADHSIATSSWIAINWNSVASDTHGMWSSGAANRLTCQVPGIYLLIGEAVWVMNATGDRAISVQLNGDTVQRTYDRKPANSGYVTMSTASVVLPMVAGDYVQLLAWHNVGSAITITGDERTYFSATWLRGPG